MDKRFLRLLQLYLGILDISVLIAVFITTVHLNKTYGSLGNEIQYSYLAVLMTVGWLSAILLFRVYNEKYVVTFENFTKITIHTYVSFVLFTIISIFFFKWNNLSRIFILEILFANAVALLANRFIYLAIYQYFKHRNHLLSKVVVIGYNTLSKKLVNYLEQEGVNKEVVGFCEELDKIDELSHYPIFVGIDRTFEICKKFGVTEIYSTIAPEQNRSIYNLIQDAEENCIRFKIVPDFKFFVNKQIHVDYVKEIPVMMMRREPLEDIGNRIKKRIFDIVVSSLVVVFVLSWLVPIISLLIWLESKGPIFFVQERTGKDKKNFKCLKFRSMHVNGDSHHKQATRNDSRITMLGRFLRKTNLDEFPQFLNVLKGDMSVVGPRPHMLKHTNEYSKLISTYMVRQLLKPGITGWAQVNGRRGETDTVFKMQERVEYDLWYMENWSLVVDLKIVFLTIFNLLKGDRNAY